MSATTRWISEHDVARLVDLEDSLAVLESGFAAEGRGAAVAMDKTMVAFGDHATLHAIGAVFDEAGLVGTKTWAHTPGGADPHLLIFDAADGSLLAVIESFVLGQLRTSGTAGIATDRLARPDAHRLAIIGTGKQALGQVAAVACVRAISRVTCFGRDAGRAAAFAARVEDELAIACSVAPSVAAAVEGAEIVTLATRATEPVLFASDLAPGTHVNAIGAIALDRREFEPQLLARCAVVATDSIGQCRGLSAELRDFYGGADGDWSQLTTLAGLAASGARRPSAADLTLFKGMGSGVEDVALGAAVLERAMADGSGVQVARTGRARPRLRRKQGQMQGSTTEEVRHGD